MFGLDGLLEWAKTKTKNHLFALYQNLIHIFRGKKSFKKFKDDKLIRG